MVHFSKEWTEEQDMSRHFADPFIPICFLLRVHQCQLRKSRKDLTHQWQNQQQPNRMKSSHTIKGRKSGNYQVKSSTFPSSIRRTHTPKYFAREIDRVTESSFRRMRKTPGPLFDPPPIRTNFVGQNAKEACTSGKSRHEHSNNCKTWTRTSIGTGKHLDGSSNIQIPHYRWLPWCQENG